MTTDLPSEPRKWQQKWNNEERINKRMVGSHNDVDSKTFATWKFQPYFPNDGFDMVKNLTQSSDMPTPNRRYVSIASHGGVMWPHIRICATTKLDRLTMLRDISKVRSIQKGQFTMPLFSGRNYYK